MRVAVPCWSVLVGLPVFVGLSLLAFSNGWAGETAGVGRIPDEHVQQAAHVSQPGQRTNQRINRPSHKPAMFHGRELRLPRMPFARLGSQPQSAGVAPPPAAGRTGGVRPAQATQPMPPTRPTPPAARAAPAVDSAAHRLATPQPTSPPHVVNPHRASLTNPDYNPSYRPAGQQQHARRTAPPSSELLHGSKPAVAERPAHLAGSQAASESSTTASHIQESPSDAEDLPATAPSPSERLMVQAHELSRSAQSIDDYTRVIETCRRTKVSQPSDEIGRYASQLAAWALNRRGQLKAEAGRSHDAMLDFDDAVRADPNCWRAIHNRGVLLAQSGDFEKAFDDFNRTIAVNDRFAKAYSNRAALLVVAGDLLAAMGDYQRAIELDPNLAVAHRGRGRVCHLVGRLDEAVGHFDAAVQLAPDDAYAVTSRADLLVDIGRYSDAAAEYKHAIELDPRSADAYRGSAWLLATCPDDSIRDPARAMELAEFALRLDSKQEALGLDTLAAAQAAAGNFPAAMQTLHRAIELAPDDQRTAYQDRLLMYQHARPFRIAPQRTVMQASFEARSNRGEAAGRDP